MTDALIVWNVILRRSDPKERQNYWHLQKYTTFPGGFNIRTLKIGVVEFSNNIKAMGQIQVDDFSKLKTGMKLKAFWEPVRKFAGEDVFGLVLR